jgi:glutamate-1-semialdehyde aminotransferase
VDFTIGFGSLLFSPRFLLDAIEAQLRRGICHGPQKDLAPTVANLVCELTGMERAAFCNSGTEAIMTALRLARTRRPRVGSRCSPARTHGTFDGVLPGPAARHDPGTASVPLAPAFHRT